MTAVIVDDDTAQRALLRSVLGKSCADMIEVIGEANSLKSAVNTLTALQPELVFLDVELTGHDTGFDVLDDIDDPNFGVIFVTAYSDFASQAYNYDPINFLTKPVEPNRLRKAVERAWRILRDEPFSSNEVSDNSPTSIPAPKQDTVPQSATITITVGSETLQFDSERIICCKAESNYTNILYQEGEGVKTHTLRMTLKEVEPFFYSSELIRVHRSHIVHPRHIQRIVKKQRTLNIELSTGEQFPIADSYRTLFYERLPKFMK